MIIELGTTILLEIIILLAILIIYFFDYTNSYIRCHKPTEPCYDKTKIITTYCPKGKVCDNEEFQKLMKELFEDD